MSLKSALTLCLCILTIISTACENEAPTNHTDNDTGINSDTDTTNTDTTNTDTTNTDTNNSDTDNSDTDNSDTGNTDTDNSDTDNSDTGITPLTLDEYLTQEPELLTEFICSSVFSCAEKQPLAFLADYGRFADKADCIAQVPSTLWGDAGYFNAEREATEAGRLEFDPQHAAECIAHIKVEMKKCQSVDEFMASIYSICKNSFIPTVEESAPCLKSNECISDRCLFDNQEECFGRCAATIELPKEGEPCGYSTHSTSCVPGLYCVQSTQDNNEYCTKPGTRQKGEICNGIQDLCAGDMTCTLEHVCDDRKALAQIGERCEDSILCQPGLNCVSTQPEPPHAGTCIVIKTAGQSCTQHADCSPNLYCSGSISTPGECTPLKKAGQSCQGTRECLDSMSCEPEAGNTCVAYETGGPDICNMPTE